MGAREPSWSERIRDLIDQADRVRGESERVRGQVERSLKEQHRIWPERRRENRLPANDEVHDHHRGAH